MRRSWTPLTVATVPGAWTWSSSWAQTHPGSPYVDQADLAAARLLLETGPGRPRRLLSDRGHGALHVIRSWRWWRGCAWRGCRSHRTTRMRR